MFRGPTPAARWMPCVVPARRVCRSLVAAFSLTMLTVAAMLPAAAFAQQVLPEIEVIANTPVQGAGVDRDKIPSTTHSVDSSDFQRSYSANTTDTLFQRVPGVTLSDPGGNSVQQEIRYRGFAASPAQGTPQGLAVYMNGVRINEAFGDTVHWDLIPSNAIQRADIVTGNPIFGLNALGGAINLQMKNGFTWQGFEQEVQGGSYGRIQGAFQYGGQTGNWSTYMAAQGLHDDGWRKSSSTVLGRFYGDVGWRDDRAEFHLFSSIAKSEFGATATTPIQMLNANWNSVYTTPQTTKNEVAMVGVNGKYALDAGWSVQGNVYTRWFRQAHVDGNGADVEGCDPASPFGDSLCFAGGLVPILDANNLTIPCPAIGCSAVPYGTIDRTDTQSKSFGGSLQATNDAKLFDHGNYFVVGGSIDRGKTDFGANSTLGVISPSLVVGTDPTVPGTGSLIHTPDNAAYSPVGINAKNTYYGIFASDTFDVTDRLSATAGARYNIAKISVLDVLGTSPDLNSSSTYSRLNPVAGLSYKVAPWMTAYGSYSESNRAPTPLELGCSNPDKPCLLESFMVSDPPLRQVVGHTYEAGLRGTTQLLGGKLDWKAGLFRTDSIDDIINVASPIQGRGYFQNVPKTRRQGVEIGAEYRSERWLAYSSYSFIDATYQFTGDLSSPNNPMASADGTVHVVPGNHIPGVPQHQFKAGAEYLVTPEWKVGGDLVAVGSQWYVGDDANQNVKLPGYVVVNLHTSYQVTKEITLFAVANNIFDKRYALFGTYFDPTGVANVALPLVLTDQRAEVPGQPLSIYGGIRIKL